MKKYVSYDKLLLTCIIVLFSIYLSITLISTSFADYTTTATCSHTALGVQYSEVAHPHKYFRTCKSCNTKVYVGGHATKNHGDGSWGSGTCPQCGSHSYPIPTVDQINASLKQHPHIVGVKCKCGSVKYTDPQINPDCSSCISTYNIKSKSATGNSVLYLSYLDGDSGAAISTTFPVPVKMTFQSKYSKSGSNFTSYSSKITCVFQSKLCSTRSKKPTTPFRNCTSRLLQQFEFKVIHKYAICTGFKPHACKSHWRKIFKVSHSKLLFSWSNWIRRRSYSSTQRFRKINIYFLRGDYQ